MQENDLVFMSGRELAALIRTRQVSPVEVTTAFLDRVEALNPKVNAFITILRDEAIANARRAEQAIGAGRYLSSLAFGVSATDPRVIGLVAFMLILIAAAACLVPALRASRVDPAEILRES